MAASLGRTSQTAPIQFSSHQALCGAGVLFLLPSLLAQGLLTTREVYQWAEKAYYSLESVVLTLAIMALARIKTPEQLKQCKPGEIGRIIGLDRIPEVRCIRDKIRFLSDQNKTLELNKKLLDQWVQPDDSVILCVDGHQRIYYGHKANLPVKYISRQRLCLNATTEYWVTDLKGSPVLVTLGELSEKLQTAIEDDIIPVLKETEAYKRHASRNDDGPRCTLVFDREAYQPAFFKRLWDNHRIAVVTYRKNVKDTWDEKCFEKAVVRVIEQDVDMLIHEQKVELKGVTFREVRRLGSAGHQTSVITNNEVITTAQIAGYMFSRWSEENFFRYMSLDYDFDKMLQFGTEPVAETSRIVNPEYRQLNYKLKKHREKIARLEAKLYPVIDELVNAPVDNVVALTHKQQDIREQITAMKEQEAVLKQQRKNAPTHITVEEMPKDQRFNKLKTESKLLLNIVKMIAYRAETAVASMLQPHLKTAEREKRMLVKQIIQSPADMIPDEENNTLTICLHTLSTPRYNKAAAELAKILTETQTVFPGTDTMLIFETTAPPNYEG